jgi:hypothetical protein
MPELKRSVRLVSSVPPTPCNHQFRTPFGSTSHISTLLHPAFTFPLPHPPSSQFASVAAWRYSVIFPLTTQLSLSVNLVRPLELLLPYLTGLHPRSLDLFLLVVLKIDSHHIRTKYCSQPVADPPVDLRRRRARLKRTYLYWFCHWVSWRLFITRSARAQPHCAAE